LWSFHGRIGFVTCFSVPALFSHTARSTFILCLYPAHSMFVLRSHTFLSYFNCFRSLLFPSCLFHFLTVIAFCYFHALNVHVLCSFHFRTFLAHYSFHSLTLFPPFFSHARTVLKPFSFQALTALVPCLFHARTVFALLIFHALHVLEPCFSMLLLYSQLSWFLPLGGLATWLFILISWTGLVHDYRDLFLDRKYN
jgi:hypothetical protein